MLSGKNAIVARCKVVLAVCLSLMSFNVQAEKLQAMIFVSSSMPKISLAQYARQAKALHASLVMRGLVNNSLKDTVSFMTSAFGDRVDAVVIDPEAFRRYQIRHVPAIVLDDGRKFDGISGAVRLGAALKRLEEIHPEWYAIGFWCDHIGGC